MTWLIRRFGPRIRVDGTRERFVWRLRDRELVLTPVMDLDTDRDRILAVGGEPPATPHRPVVHATVTGLDAHAVERTLRRAGAGVVEVGT